MINIDVVSVLQQRVDFLSGIADVAKDCNWGDDETQELLDYLTNQLVEIDNLLYDTYEETSDKRVAFVLWENRMEELRHWLSMVLGIKIKYI